MITWDWYEERRMMLLAQGVDGRVLDVGYADKPNDHFVDQARVTGIDLVESPIVPEYAEQIVGDLCNSDVLQGRTFDWVTAGEVLEHLQEPYGFLRCIRDLLKEGGKLRLSTPNPVGFPVLFYEIARSRARFYASDHTYYFSPRWVVRMLEVSGFSEIRMKAVGLWLPGVPIPISPISLSYQIVYSARKRS